MTTQIHTVPGVRAKEGRVGNVVAAFSADQVAKLTGLTLRQLAYWDNIGFFRPQHASENRRSPYSRIYSFADLVGLRTISVLKNGYNVTMSHLKATAEKLSRYTKRPWSEIKLGVWNREVIWIEPDSGQTASVVTRQYIIFELVDVINDMENEVKRLRNREATEYGRIVKHRNIAHNRPVFAGTRIPVESVQNFAKAGYTAEQILSEYPSLTKDDIKKALESPSPRTAA